MQFVCALRVEFSYLDIGMTILKRVFTRLPRFAQILLEDTQHMNEYGRFMRVAMTVGTAIFLYRFVDTMVYMEREKRPETDLERIHRRIEERRIREQLSQEALKSSKIAPPTASHIENVIAKANSQ